MDKPLIPAIPMDRGHIAKHPAKGKLVRMAETNTLNTANQTNSSWTANDFMSRAILKANAKHMFEKFRAIFFTRVQESIAKVQSACSRHIRQSFFLLEGFANIE